ncbi:MAG: TIGR04283 family arsenosugar biosynthesis glycosyltransferase [Nitrospirales bacterium]
MTIAVIIPVLNEETVLPGLMPNLLAMGFDEIIVVDGGSQDRTLDIVRPFLEHTSSRGIQLISSARGRAVQLNAGASNTHADILVFLHADTNLPDTAVQRICQVMADVSCVGGRFDVRFPVDRGWAWVISRMMNLRSRWSGICTGDQTIFVRRRIFQRLGGFADIPLMEDIEFTRRLKTTGRVVALRDKVTTSFRRWERGGPLRTILRMWTLRFLYWMGWPPKTLRQFYDETR